MNRWQILCPLAALLITGLLLWCGLMFLAGRDQQKGFPVRFVVPAAFRGPITVVQRDDGTDVYPEKGIYVYGVPTNGTLVVSSLEAFRVWHETDALVSPPGIPLPVRETSEPEGATGEIVLYELASPAKEIRLFVGTHVEMEAYVRKPVFETEVSRWLAGSITNGTNRLARP